VAQALDDRGAGRQVVESGVAGPHPEGRCGQREQRDGGGAAEQDRAAYHAAHQRVPQPRAARGRASPADQREPASVHATAEPGEQGGEHGDRPEHGDADHADRADRHAGEDVDAGQEESRQGDHDGQPGDDLSTVYSPGEWLPGCRGLDDTVKRVASTGS